MIYEKNVWLRRLDYITSFVFLFQQTAFFKNQIKIMIDSEWITAKHC